MKRRFKNMVQCKYCSNYCTVIMTNWNNKMRSKACYIAMNAGVISEYFDQGAESCPYFEIAQKYAHTDLANAINDIRQLPKTIKHEDK